MLLTVEGLTQSNNKQSLKTFFFFLTLGNHLLYLDPHTTQQAVNPKKMSQIPDEVFFQLFFIIKTPQYLGYFIMCQRVVNSLDTCSYLVKELVAEDFKIPTCVRRVRYKNRIAHDFLSHMTQIFLLPEVSLN